MEKVYATFKLPEDTIQFLQEHVELEYWEGEGIIPREILLEKVKNVTGLYVSMQEKVDKELFDHAPSLKVVSTMSVGFDHIDIVTAKERNIVVTNTPGVLTEATADLTFALVLATARRIVEASEVLKTGKWQYWSPLFLAGMDIYNKTIGIIGMGRIGEAVARRAKGFNMKILYHNRNRKVEVEEELGAKYSELNQLLTDSDFVVLLTPLTNETKLLMKKEQFNLMKPTAVFINVSRGATVDEEALYEALKNKTIWAAGLDVFQKEPLPLDHPFLTLENVVLLPHIGSASLATRKEMAIMAAQDLVNVLTGKEALNIVK